jgi:hypothetical protein
MMTIDEINLLLQEAAEEENEFQLDARYQEFLDEMYYIYACDEWEIELEFYNEFG